MNTTYYQEHVYDRLNYQKKYNQYNKERIKKYQAEYFQRRKILGGMKKFKQEQERMRQEELERKQKERREWLEFITLNFD